MVKIKVLLNVLAACIALIGYLPLLPYLGPLAKFFLPAALLAGFLLQQRDRALPPRVLTPLSFALFFYFAFGFTLDRLVPVTGDLLVVFLGVRLLGERIGRNYLQVYGLSLFCLAASSLYELSAVFVAYLLLLLLLLAVSLVLLTFHAHDDAIVLPVKQARKVLTVAVAIPVVSLPMILFLFVLLPRTQFPLWQFMNPPAGKKTGLSDTVKPGEASAVGEVNTVVLRAVSEKVPEERLYWRGVVLNGFRENAWVRLPAPEERQPVARGSLVSQEIYPERSQTPYLPALNLTRTISGIRHDASADAVFAARRPLDRKVKYLAQSVLSDEFQVPGGVDGDFYLQLPQKLPARLSAKAREWSRAELDPAQRMRLVEEFIRGQRITYANTGLPVGPEPLDSFLFEKRRGNCEYFATSYATMLRVAGVPSRLVGGYRGGNYNEMAGYYVVTEDMAHVWVEAYLDGVGWRTVDPSAWAIGSLPRRAQARGLAMYVDAIGFYWDKAVVSYDLEKQIALVRSAGNKARDFRLPAATGKVLATLAVLLVPLAVVVPWYLARPASAEGRVLRRMQKVLRKRYPGVVSGEEGLFDLAGKLDDPYLREFVALYGAAVYRDRRLDRDELAKLNRIVDQMGQHRS